MNYKLEIPPQCSSSDVVAVDSEWLGLQEKRLHRPQGISTFACAQFTLNGDTAYIVTAPDAMPKAYEHIRKSTLVFCNAAFDYIHLRQLAEFLDKKKMWDIQLFEKILYGGYYSKFSLKDMVRRYFQVAMPKESREEFAKGSAMTEEMLQYAADDCCYTWRIYQEQNKIARDEDISIWYNVELQAFWPTISFAGFPLNVTKWTELANYNNEKAAELEKTFTFNPNSPKQVKDFIKQNYGLEVESSDEKHLLKLQKKIPIAKTLLDYRHYKKRASTYGLSWLDAVESDGRVHSQFNQIGAETGRYSSDNINLQNVPNDKECRSCFESPPGYKMIIGDYQAQEPRILAHFSQDKELIKIFRGGGDVHGEIGMRIYETDTPILKGDVRRQISKKLGLGLDYGLTAKGLKRNLEAEDIIISEEEAEKLVAEFFSSFPQVESWIAKQRKFAAKNEYVLDIYDRKLHVNNYSYQAQNNAINAPIQGSAAVMLKLALADFYNSWPEEWNESIITAHLYSYVYKPKWDSTGTIGVIHDELDVLTLEKFAEPCRDLLQLCMERSGQQLIPGIPCKAEVGIYENWGQKE